MDLLVRLNTYHHLLLTVKPSEAQSFMRSGGFLLFMTCCTFHNYLAAEVARKTLRPHNIIKRLHLHFGVKAVMYRLLIADDEPIIVDGLCELFEEDNALEREFDVFRAYNGAEAARLLRQQRIDVLLTDIQMPGHTGLELLRMANKLWPRCKVIMLTGYNDFEYIQEAIRGGSLDYVLKTEGDEKIVGAVERACLELDREWEADELFARAKASIGKALPVLRRELLLSLLEGRQSPSESAVSESIRQELSLVSERSAFVVLGRVDDWRDKRRKQPLTARDDELVAYAVRNIAEEYAMPRARMVHVELPANDWVWLVQDGEETDPEASARFVRGTLEGAQRQCETLLGVHSSYLFASLPSGWSAIAELYSRMSAQFRFGGFNGTMTLGEWTMPEATTSASGSVPASDRYYYDHRLKGMETAIESGNRQLFLSHLGELTREAAERSVPRTEIAAEVFAGIAHVLLSCMNRIGAADGAAGRFDTTKAADFKQFPSWREIEAYFAEFGGWLMELIESRRPSAGSVRDPIMTVKKYIAEHLTGDVSLGRLGEQVYLNPFYLSRLFKKHTGISITDYIIHARIERAKELLRSTNRRVNDIALEVGFESASYFTRFFKRLIQMTPVEFREKSL